MVPNNEDGIGLCLRESFRGQLEAVGAVVLTKVCCSCNEPLRACCCHAADSGALGGLTDSYSLPKAAATFFWQKSYSKSFWGIIFCISEWILAQTNPVLLADAVGKAMVTIQHPHPQTTHMWVCENLTSFCLIQSSAKPPSLLHPQLLAVPTARPSQPRGKRPFLIRSPSLHDKCCDVETLSFKTSSEIRSSYGKVSKQQGER